MAEGRGGDQIKAWASERETGMGTSLRVRVRHLMISWEWGGGVCKSMSDCSERPYRHRGSTRSRSRKSWSLFTEEISIGNWESVREGFVRQ